MVAININIVIFINSIGYNWFSEHKQDIYIDPW